MSKNFKDEMMNAIEEYLECFDCFYQKNKNFVYIQMKTERPIKNFNCAFYVTEEGYIIYISKDIPKVDKATGAALYEFVNKVNMYLLEGDLEVDLDSGYVAYKEYVRPSRPIEKASVGTSVVKAFCCFETYAHGFAHIMVIKADADEAIMVCEQQTDGQ